MRFVAALLLLPALLTSCRDESAASSGKCEGRDVRLVDKGTLMVALDLRVPPFAFLENGEPAGAEVDLARAVAKRMALEPRIVDHSTPALLPGVAARRFDVAGSALRATTDVAAQACLSAAVFPGRLAVVVHDRHSPDVGKLDDVSDGRILAAAGTAAARWARSELASAVTVPVVDDAFAELGAGLAKAIVTDLETALYREAKEDRALRVIEEIEVPDRFVWAVHRSNAALRDALNEVLGDLGERAAIEKKWFGRTLGSGD